MIKKLLTCKTYLKALDETRIVARLDSDKPDANLLVKDVDNDSYEELKDVPGVTLTVRRPRSCRNYLVGEIADRLYAYEQLGYSPEELQKIIAEHEVYKTRDSVIAIITGRMNGKTRALNAVYGSLMNNLDIRDLYPSTMIVPRTPEPENVIFNDPATIVFWKDGTKTVVKATNEDFDPEKGLAMAIAKKALGNKGNYFNSIKKWTEKYEAEREAEREAKTEAERVISEFEASLEKLRNRAGAFAWKKED